MLFLAVCMGLFGHNAHADDEFLDPSVAFKFSSAEQPGEVDLRFAIADGYYMYRERFAFAVKSGHATLGEPQLPAGKVKFDDTFQKNVETYRGDIVVRVPIKQAGGPFDLSVISQGCADKGICYPPAEHVVHVHGVALQPAAPAATLGAVSGSPPGSALASGHASGGAGAEAVSPAGPAAAAGADESRDRLYSQQYAQTVLEGHGLVSALGIFFLLGVALSLLPCSLPMIPILSSIILGEGSGLTRRRGFTLSLCYVLGMAVVYTAFGVLAALAGQSLGVWLQNPWVLGAFAVLLVAFALSLFGFYELQLPQAWQNRVGGISARQSGGKLAAVFAMGAVSALVVGACMTAPLFGVLAFIAQTGNVAFGGAALFVMALGIGVPLLVIGIGAGALVPRAGAWMETVKRCFGMLLLAAALWIAVPILPALAIMLLWALWLLLGAAGLGVFGGGRAEAIVSDGGIAGAGSTALPRRSQGAVGAAAATVPWRAAGKALGAALALCAALLLVGAAAGSRDPLQPLAVFAAGGSPGGAAAAATAANLPFGRVKSGAELDRALHASASPAMLDFYADWCVSCKEMEKFSFSDPRVRARLAQLNLLQADVTANNGDDQQLLKRFKLYGPPAIIFFDATGREVLRVVGYQPPDTFLRSLDQAFGPARS
jgi:thiol:disulfide interchange protein DsbD